MSSIPAWSTRFLASTRGRIVSLLRLKGQTVRELATALELTDNAVRAHLATLERDGLIQHGALRRGLRKPHFTYELTREAEHLFPKPYGLVLGQLLDVLHSRLKRATLEDVLREVGRHLATTRPPTLPKPAAQKNDLKRRLESAVKAFVDLGGLAHLERTNGKIVIRGQRCPLSTIVVSHPEVCVMTETVLAEILGVPVVQRCKTTDPPECLFAVATAVGRSRL